jgi:inhibitor of KinA sporulation pathway (predicted exonuclease)
MINLPDGDFVLADLEYTSWDGAMARDWGGPGEFREIVQIGAVKVTRAGGWHEVDALMVLVRPTLNPVLSDYFTNLTGITDADIARAGVPVTDALERFSQFTGALPILTHGRDDLVVVEECVEKSIDNPFANHDWCDINPGIRAMTGRDLMSSELPAHLGLPQKGQTHDALPDARALLAVLAHFEAPAVHTS